MPDWSVYILCCADDSLYTGITTDVERRLQEHNSNNKKSAAYTRARRPVEIVYVENLKNRSEATSRELEIKKLSRTEKLELIKLSKTSISR